MTFDNYIDNPNGSQAFTNRQMYKNLYTEKFDKLLLKAAGNIPYTLYTGSNDYYVHFKIPNEELDDFYYDVVIRLYTKKSEFKSERTLKNYDVQFYSNDPGFVYTFAYSFNKNGLFIKDLKPKMSKIALSTASSKNPKNDTWYVKSFYFAYLAMKHYGLFDKTSYTGAKKYTTGHLLSKVTHADTKIQQRQEEGRLQKSSKNSKDKSKNPRRTQETNAKLRNVVKTAKTTTTGKVSNKSKVTKSVKRK